MSGLAEFRLGWTLILGGMLCGCRRKMGWAIALAIVLGAVVAGMGWMDLMH